MSDAPLDIAPGPLPDVTNMENPQGPLANRFTPIQREKRDAQDAAHKERAEYFMEVLVEAGEDEVEVRLFLGLPVEFTEDNDPRPWVVYAQKPEVDKDLAARIAEVMAAGGDAEAVAAVLAANQGMNPPQMQEAVDSDECNLCGAIVGDLDKHMSYAHDTEGTDNGEQLSPSTGEADSGTAS